MGTSINSIINPIREVEKKIDVPLDVPIDDDLVGSVKGLLGNNEWGYIKSTDNTVAREVTYYDTGDFYFYHAGDTVRRRLELGKKFEEAAYAYKTGRLDARVEYSHKTRTILSPAGIAELFSQLDEFPDTAGDLEIKAMVITTSRKLDFKHSSGDVVEIKFDYYHVQGGGEFKEVEVEFTDGETKTDQQKEQTVLVIQEIIANWLGYKKIYRQKYDRIIGSMPQYTKYWKFNPSPK